MTDTVLVAVLSLMGTLFGSLGGVLTANRLINYRLEKLEEKVSLHNRLIERTYKLESRMDTCEDHLKQLNSFTRG